MHLIGFFWYLSVCVFHGVVFFFVCANNDYFRDVVIFFSVHSKRKIQMKRLKEMDKENRMKKMITMVGNAR